MLEVTNLSKKFTNKKKGKITTVDAVKNVSFKCYPGKIFGLLGPNGAGKTTSLRCISTLLKPTKGNIYFDEYNVIGDSKMVRSKIGFLTSDMKLDGFFTPDYMINYFGKLNKMEKKAIQAKKEILFKDLKMKDFINKKIDKLSSGMKQKSAIAISLIHDPEVIIFDEPTNGLDVITAKNVTDFLRKYAESGKTVIISTHIMSVVKKLCDTVGVLINGELKELGTSQEIIEKNDAKDLEEVFFKYILPEEDIESEVTNV